MLNEFLRFGLVFALVLVFVIGGGGTVCMRAVLKWLSGLGFIMEVRRGDESDKLFERVFRVFPDEEVYESGYATEETLKVVDYERRPEFSGRGTVIRFERNGYCSVKDKNSAAGSTVRLH